MDNDQILDIAEEMVLDRLEENYSVFDASEYAWGHPGVDEEPSDEDLNAIARVANAHLKALREEF